MIDHILINIHTYIHTYIHTTSAKLYIYIGVGARDLYIDESHTALDIFRMRHFLVCTQLA